MNKWLQIKKHWKKNSRNKVKASRNILINQQIKNKKKKNEEKNGTQVLCLLSGEQNSVKLSLIKARNSLSNLGLSKTGDKDLQRKATSHD